MLDMAVGGEAGTAGGGAPEGNNRKHAARNLRGGMARGRQTGRVLGSSRLSTPRLVLALAVAAAMSFFCSISGEPPQDPVVSSKSGHVYERRLILKYITENGTDPITGDKLEEADLVTVKASAYIMPHSNRRILLTTRAYDC